MTHVPTGEKLSLREEGKLRIIDVYLEDDEQNRYKTTVGGSQDELLGETLAYQARSTDERLKPNELLHLKMGHPGLNTQAKICRAEGMDPSPIECIVCERLKLVNTRNRQPSEHVATEIGGRVCVDFMEGIGNPDANGGVNSLLVGVDESSDQTGVIAVKNSSQPHMLLEKLLEEMFREEVPVKRLRLDNQFNTIGVHKRAEEN